MDFKILIEVVSLCFDVLEIIRRLIKLIAIARKAKKKYRPKLRKS